MLSKEITVWGYIKIPYPYLEHFNKRLSEFKGASAYTDFPDFISEPVNSLGNAISTFGYFFRYEERLEEVLLERFENFINSIKFLMAVIQLSIEDGGNYFYEYISDGDNTHKYVNSIEMKPD